MIKSLTFTQSDPSNMLIDAFKEFELESDNTEKIFREIGDGLKAAIDVVLEAATLMFTLKF